MYLRLNLAAEHFPEGIDQGFTRIGLTVKANFFATNIEGVTNFNCCLPTAEKLGPSNRGDAPLHRSPNLPRQ
jgi:hypothetical protein